MPHTSEALDLGSYTERERKEKGETVYPGTFLKLNMGQDCICILLFISKCMLHGIFNIVFHKVRTEIHVNATDFKNAHFESVFAFVRAFLAYIFNYKA